MPWSQPTRCFSRRATARPSRDIGAGAIDSVIITTSSIRPPQEAGRTRVLAVTSLKVRERLDAAGAVLVTDEPADFTAWLEGQRTLLGKLIVDGNIKLG